VGRYLKRTNIPVFSRVCFPKLLLPQSSFLARFKFFCLGNEFHASLMASYSPVVSVSDEKPGAAVSDGVRSDTEKGVVAAHAHKHHDPNWTGNDVDFQWG
jgi:hypothetical protein